jgi:hypothetical protein
VFAFDKHSSLLVRRVNKVLIAPTSELLLFLRFSVGTIRKIYYDLLKLILTFECNLNRKMIIESSVNSQTASVFTKLLTINHFDGALC